MAKYLSRTKTFSFPRKTEGMSKKEHDKKWWDTYKKRSVFDRKVKKAGGIIGHSETYAVSRDSPKGPIHRMVRHYKMPKGSGSEIDKHQARMKKMPKKKERSRKELRYDEIGIEKLNFNIEL